jgi:hypothetical protein
MEIQQSQQFEQFKTVNGNRNISMKKVNKIMEDVKNGLNLFPYCPVIVNPSPDGLLIIDGQHRFTACVKLDMPIYYVMAENIALRDIARMNSNTDKWKNSDFLQAYIKLGIKDYQTLGAFMKKYHCSYSLAVSLLMHGKVRHNGRNIEWFRDGDFKATHIDYGTVFIQGVDELFDAYVFYRHAPLLEAVEKLNKKGLWDFDTMKRKLQENRHQMDKQTTAKNYMYLLDRIYNTRNRERRQIF